MCIGEEWVMRFRPPRVSVSYFMKKEYSIVLDYKLH